MKQLLIVTLAFLSVVSRSLAEPIVIGAEQNPAFGQIEEGSREVPGELSQIWLGNRIGPEDPDSNTWGVPEAVASRLGIENITVDD